jgi:glycosyltransferase involved in cell wall biosynthesis
VIAFGVGGALDTVIAGETGTFFHEPTPEALADAVRAFDAEAIDPAVCRANAERFAVTHFRERLLAVVDRLLSLPG